MNVTRRRGINRRNSNLFILEELYRLNSATNMGKSFEEGEEEVRVEEVAVEEVTNVEEKVAKEEEERYRIRMNFQGKILFYF